MSHASPGASYLNAPQHRHIYDVLQAWAVRTPDAPALLAAGRMPLTYGRLRRHIEDVVQRLRTLGVGRQDRIALALPTGPEMAVAFLAVAAGAVCAPLHAASSTDELDAYLTDLDARALMVLAGTETPARAMAHMRGMQIIELSPVPGAEAGLFTLTGEQLPHAGPHGFTQPNDVALVLPTSGTTSRPRRVPLTHTNICTAADNMRVTLALVARDRCLNVLPFFHVHALLTALLTSLVAGASCVCNPGFSPAAFFAAMAEFRPTWYTAVPTLHRAILASVAQHCETIADYPLRFIRSASAPLPQRVLAELERVFKAPVIETYGMTETAAQITSNPLPPAPRRPGSVGVAAGPEVAIMSPEGGLLPAEAIGEVVVRGPTVFQGYENNPTANRSAFTDGWFRTGDQGFLDAHGYLFITGRLREIINRGGEKIAPQEVDDVLLGHPAVAQAVTFAVPHARLGEDLAAAVVLHRHAGATEHDLRLFAAARLAAFKVPQRIYLVADLPKSPTGKLPRLGLAAKLGLTVPGQAQSTMQSEGTAAGTQLEELLAGLYAQVLNLAYVGNHDDFFQLGGDSILATQLVARIRATLHVELSLRSFFETSTVARMAQSIEAARQVTPGLQPPPQPMPRHAPLPLSYAQQRLWFLDQLEPGSAVYNLPIALRLTGVLDVTAWEKSLEEIVRRHEILRTIFPAQDGRPVQVVVPALPLTLPVVDLRVLPEASREAAVQQRATAESRQSFDLAQGPLWRVKLLRLADQAHVFLLNIHHMVFDGWSFDVFLRELTALYTAFSTGKPAPLPVLPLQYSDFALWQRRWLQGAMLEAELTYWQQQLDGHLPVLALPTDRPRPPLQSFRGACQSLVLSAPLTEALKALSRQEGVTLFMTLLTAFKTLLYRYTGQEDLLIGTPIAGRTRVETEALIGCFVNTLGLRTNLGGKPRFRELLGQVRKVALDAYDHQALPFEQLVDALRLTRSPSHAPLVQVMFALQNAPPTVRTIPGLTLDRMAVEQGTAKFDLTLSMRDTEQGLQGTLEYALDLFDQATIARMLGHFQTLLEGVVAHPEHRLTDLPLLTEAELHHIRMAWHDTTADYPQDTCLHGLFEAWAERTPDAVAVVCNAQQLTYSALNRRANQLAHHLRALGVGPEVCVGLCMERSVELVVGLLGILKAGGAYIPLDPAYPRERLAFMLADTQASVLVTQRQMGTDLPAHTPHLVYLDTDWEHIAPQSEANPASGVTPENLAYVMYTSGSTGTPKGVMLEQRQVLAFLYGFEHVAPGGVGCTGTAVCPCGFDVSVWEYFSMLCFGGTLHIIVPDILMNLQQFGRYLLDHRITSAYIPPALLSELASHLEQQPAQMALDRLLVGTEPIKQALLQRFRNLSADMRIVNGYGPTETTVCATLLPFCTATEPDRRTPIGTGIRGYEVYLVDANRQLVPIGLPGELHIGGVGVARGYLNHPELSAEKFIPHPFRDRPGTRLYKTGDLARYLADGNLEFLGRLDQQVKIRGFRVEPGEVEAVLAGLPGVRESVVVAREDQPGAKRLVAYVVPNPSSQGRSSREFILYVRRVLTEKLPDYMIPSAFVMLETLPMTPNGKVDRQSLPAPDMGRVQAAGAFVAPRTTAERILADIWADVLRLERVGMHDNFFALGGDSILSIQIIARAHQTGLRLTPKQLFQHQTIAELATVAGITPSIQAEQGLVLGPVPCTPIQQWFFEQDMPDPHHWNQALLLEVRHTLDVSALEQAVQHLLVHHDMLRARFRREADGWQQAIIAPEAFSLCMRVDLSTLSEEQQGREMAQTAAQLQASLNLAQGPLLRVALFDCGPHRPACLLVVIHHLVVDSVSWRIVLADLQMAYQQRSAGQMIRLPPKTTSFKHWAERLTAYAPSAELRQELTYWLAVPCAQVGRLPVDYPGDANTVAWARTVSVSLSTAETRALLQEVPKAYQLQINDVLLTALAQTLARWTGERTLLLDLEGHGREEGVDGVDLSRTVGWFTTLFPVFLQLEHTYTPAAALKSVKEQLRRIPRRGFGYGVLRYLSQDTEVIEALRSLPPAEVCFNYLGRGDQLRPGPLFSGPLREASGPHRSKRGRRCYLLEVNSRLTGGQLQCDWTYSERTHRRDTVAGLARSFIEALRILIRHCQSPEAGGYTPSDFPTMRLSQQELDELMITLSESGTRDEP